MGRFSVCSQCTPVVPYVSLYNLFGNTIAFFNEKEGMLNTLKKIMNEQKKIVCSMYYWCCLEYDSSIAELESQKHCEISWIFKDKDSPSHNPRVSQPHFFVRKIWLQHYLYCLLENLCSVFLLSHRYVENGSLANIIKPNKFGPFPESLVAVYIAQVC